MTGSIHLKLNFCDQRFIVDFMRELTTADSAPSVAQSTLEREFVANSPIWRIFLPFLALTGRSTAFFSPRKDHFRLRKSSPRSGSAKRRQGRDCASGKSLARLPTRESGERTHIDTARIELKPLLAGFLHKRLAPCLTSGAGRLQHIEKLLPMLPSNFRPIARLRLQRITKRHKRASSLLPLAQKLLQGD